MVLAQETLGVNLVDFLRARRTCCKPAILGNHFDSSNWIAVSRSGGQNLLDRLPSNFGSVNVGWGQSCKSGFLFGRSGSIDAFVDGISQLAGEILINFTGILSHARRNFCREQTRNNSVLVCGPHVAVAPEEGRTSAFLASETQAASEQAFDKPFKAHRYLIKMPTQAHADTIDHAAAHYGFPNGNFLAPGLPIRK